MHITRAIIKNYRCLQDSNIKLNEKLNILVGDNECGKSTFLQAIQLALTWLGIMAHRDQSKRPNVTADYGLS